MEVPDADEVESYDNALNDDDLAHDDHVTLITIPKIVKTVDDSNLAYSMAVSRERKRACACRETWALVSGVICFHARIDLLVLVDVASFFGVRLNLLNAFIHRPGEHIEHDPAASRHRCDLLDGLR